MSSSSNSSMALREMRRAGARALFSRRWFGRALTVSIALYFLQLAVAGFFAWARQTIGFSSWSDFLQAKANAMRGGLGYVVPSRAVALNYTYASSFELFFSLIVAGIFLFGVTTFALRMLKGEDSRGYFAGAFGGFARPLGAAWLLFRINVQIFLWSCLFVVPGVVAYYRYRAAWYLKAENPDWPAGQCLAESARVMAGHKLRCCALDLSYLFLLGLLSLALGGALAGGALLPAAIKAPITFFAAPLAIFATICFCWYVFAGRTAFYLSIKGSAGTPPPCRCGILPHPDDNDKEATAK